jgi:MFS superfamily sulfate permease-like transporter
MDSEKKAITGLTFKYLKNDLPSGLVVFLVALPLCLGIALASGAPLFSGIIAGIVGGTVIAFASGSALSVSGPAAGLTVIVHNAITGFGNYQVFLLAVSS